MIRAISSSTPDRSAGLAAAQARRASCAASSASSTSAAVPLATSQNTLPFTGDLFSKYWPFTGGTQVPPM